MRHGGGEHVAGKYLALTHFDAVSQVRTGNHTDFQTSTSINYATTTLNSVCMEVRRPGEGLRAGDLGPHIVCYIRGWVADYFVSGPGQIGQWPCREVRHWHQRSLLTIDQCLTRVDKVKLQICKQVSKTRDNAESRANRVLIKSCNIITLDNFNVCTSVQ